MTSLVDSEPAFRARALEIGLSEALLNSMAASSVKTMSQYAFCSQPPGKPIEDGQLTTFLQNAIGGAVAVGQLTIAKRLFFEAHTLVMRSLKERLEASDQTPVRKMNHAERDSRIAKQKARLGGIRFKGELEIAHSLIDAVNHQIEQKQLRYLAPQKCIKREMEILGKKPEQTFVLDNGALSVKQPELHLQCDVHSELQAFDALQRRALAYDLCSLLSYDVSMDYIHYLFEHLHRDSAPGYVRPDLAAILRADRQTWLLLIESCKSFEPEADGSSPLDKQLGMLKSHPEVAFHLLPRPGGHKRAADSTSKPPSAKPRDRGPKSQQCDKRFGAKGKGKGGNSKKPPMPKELLGHASTTATGEPICYDFNLPHGCAKAEPGQRCSKGLHVCCKYRCGKARSLSQHHE